MITLWTFRLILFNQTSTDIIAGMIDSYSPLTTLVRVLNRWKLFVALALAGAIAGGLAFSLFPPVYEARAGITFNFDKTITGDLTETQEDEALGVAGELVYSTYVMYQVSSDAALEGIQIQPAELRSTSSQERRAYIWYLHVRHKDAQSAARLANLWVERGIQELDDATYHSGLYRSMQRYMDSLETCIQDSVSQPPAYALCKSQNLASLTGELQAAGERLQKERLEARGLLPGLVFSWMEKAETPAEPVVRSRNIWILAGAFVGMLIGLLLVFVDVFKPGGRR